MKEYTVLYKFSDVIITVEAESKKEAREISDTRLTNDEIKEDTYCYEVEVEEMK